MEFFDSKDNFGKDKVLVGRPWRKEELRLKSNEDLHKLWYILLKERNMLLTMEKEYEEEAQLMPSPERTYKVEESMENLMEVVRERDCAIKMLETGTTGEPELVWRENELGIKDWREPTEHYEPEWKGMQPTRRLLGPWINRWMRQLREKKLMKLRGSRRRQKRYEAYMKRDYPDHYPENFGNLGVIPHNNKRR